MDTNTIRQNLHSYVDGANHAELLHLLHLMEDTDEHALAYEDGDMVELKERVENYRSGKTKPISAEESKARLEQIRKQARNSDR
jgi:hypothetical protein